MCVHFATASPFPVAVPCAAGKVYESETDSACLTLPTACLLCNDKLGQEQLGAAARTSAATLPT